MESTTGVFGSGVFDAELHNSVRHLAILRFLENGRGIVKDMQELLQDYRVLSNGFRRDYQTSPPYITTDN